MCLHGVEVLEMGGVVARMDIQDVAGSCPRAYGGSHLPYPVAGALRVW